MSSCIPNVPQAITRDLQLTDRFLKTYIEDIYFLLASEQTGQTLIIIPTVNGFLPE